MPASSLWRRAKARLRAERREVWRLRQHWETVLYDRRERDPGRLSVEQAGQLVEELHNLEGNADLGPITQRVRDLEKQLQELVNTEI